MPNMEQAMLADAVATVCGAVCGTSTVSSYVEASAGIAEGGKDRPGGHGHGGTVSPGHVSQPGGLPCAKLRHGGGTDLRGHSHDGLHERIDWQNTADAVPAFLDAGDYAHDIQHLLWNCLWCALLCADSGVRGQGKKLNGGTWVIAGLFTLMFLVTTDKGGNDGRICASGKGGLCGVSRSKGTGHVDFSLMPGEIHALVGPMARENPP